jgi:hypothetical protein
VWVREAFGELYAGQAGQMAERMGRLRAKEVAKREAFLKHVERYMPAPLLSGDPSFGLNLSVCQTALSISFYRFDMPAFLPLISRIWLMDDSVLLTYTLRTCIL